MDSLSFFLFLSHLQLHLTCRSCGSSVVPCERLSNVRHVVSCSCGFNTARIMSYSGESCARNRRCGRDGARRHAARRRRRRRQCDSLFLLYHPLSSSAFTLLYFAMHLPRPDALASVEHVECISRTLAQDLTESFFSNSRFVSSSFAIKIDFLRNVRDSRC